MMLPALTATPVDSATAGAESAVDSGDGGSAFAAAIAQLGGATQASAPPTETLSLELDESATADTALVMDPVPATPIEAIDWLLGQRAAAGTDSATALGAEGVSLAGLAGSTPGTTLVQMLAWRSTSVASAPGSSGVAAEVAAAASAASGLSGEWVTGLSSMKVSDSQPITEASLADELLSNPLQNGEDAAGTMLLEPVKSEAPSIDSPPQMQAVRTETSAKGATAALHTPVGTRAWNEELASKLTWLIDRGEQLASIRVTPDSLGPIDIRIAVREGEASIWFGASQADTRQAIEQAIPRLREMLASQGLSLSDAGVFQQAPNDPQRALLRNDLRRAAQESGDPTPIHSAALPRRPGLIDDYA